LRRDRRATPAGGGAGGWHAIPVNVGVGPTLVAGNRFCWGSQDRAWAQRSGARARNRRQHL